ncbi:hypothetical protein BD779DRAFT_1675641 [Infundibulicybe gibba]|nr:hypothetical protein BD779DRAFT_1675641 [Infundibulicybe gibba]
MHPLAVSSTWRSTQSDSTPPPPEKKSRNNAKVRPPTTSPGHLADSSMESNPSTSHTSPTDFLTQEDDEDKPPPAKRAPIIF